MKDEGFVPRAWPDTFILPCVLTQCYPHFSHHLCPSEGRTDSNRSKQREQRNRAPASLFSPLPSVQNVFEGHQWHQPVDPAGGEGRTGLSALHDSSRSPLAASRSPSVQL